MDVQLDLPNRTPFNFSTILPSLQILAATKVALQLWRDKICVRIEMLRDLSCIPGYYLDYSCLDKSREFSCREVIDVPTRIGDMIDERILFVGNELRSWLGQLTILCSEHLLEELSTAKIFTMFSLFFDDIVFKQDCTVCVKNTVASMLTSTKVPIAPATKYRMACEYCLENWVRELWPVVNNSVELLGRSSSVLYWNTVLTEENRGTSVDDGLKSAMTKQNWTAVEYFWNAAPDTEKTRRAINILRNANFHVMKFMLPKLNDNQANEVCAELGDYIFGKMIEKIEYFEYAMISWIYLKDYVSEIVFNNVIRRLWLIFFNPSDSDLEIIIRNGGLLREIWISAPVRLKAFVLNVDNFIALFALLDDQVRGVHKHDINFVFEILENAGRELGRNVWMEYWRKLIIRLGPSKLVKFMRLCLANEEIEQFEEQKMANFEELEPYFRSCIETKSIAELRQYLRYFVRNPRRLENLSKEIIFSNLHAIVCYDDNDFAKFISFIRGTFCNSQSANKFIEELILAPEFLALIRTKLDNGFFEQVISISGRLSCSETNTNEMKRGLVDYCKNNLTRGQIAGFNGQKIENFLRWCSLNETSISEFRQSLIPDDIFGMLSLK